MNSWVYLVDLTGRHKGQVRAYHRHAAPQAISSGFAREATQAELEAEHALDHMNPNLTPDEAEDAAPAAEEVDKDPDDGLDDLTKQELLDLLENELAVDIESIEGSGSSGNILKSDLVATARAAMVDDAHEAED